MPLKTLLYYKHRNAKAIMYLLTLILILFNNLICSVSKNGKIFSNNYMWRILKIMFNVVGVKGVLEFKRCMVSWG